MKRVTLLSFGALLALGLIVAIGCSTDRGTDNPTPQPDPEAASFVESSVAQALADGASESIVQTMALFDFPVTSPNRPSVGFGRAADSSDFDSVIYTYTNGNHAFYFVTSNTDTVGVDSFVTLTIRGYDTVTLWDNNVGQPDRDSTTDSLRARLIVTLDLAGPGFAISTSRRHVVNVDGNPWIDPAFGVDGNLLDTVNLGFSNDSGSCELGVYSSGNVLDVVLDSAVIYGDACPTAGALDFNAALALSCQGNGGLTQLNVNGAWGIEVSWSNGVQTTHLTHNGVDYTSTDSCGVEPVYSKLNGMSWGKK